MLSRKISVSAFIYCVGSPLSAKRKSLAYELKIIPLSLDYFFPLRYNKYV